MRKLFASITANDLVKVHLWLLLLHDTRVLFGI